MDHVDTTCMQCEAGNTVFGPFNVTMTASSDGGTEIARTTDGRRLVFKRYECTACGCVQSITGAERDGMTIIEKPGVTYPKAA